MNAEHERKTVAAVVPQQRQNQTVLWLIAILLAIIATVLVVRPSDVLSLPPAYGNTSMMGARGIFAFTGQLDKHSYGLFMMDVDSSNVWCYQYVPTTRKLKLVAARSFLYDRYLEDHNCEEPTPATTKMMLDQQRQIQERIIRGGIGPDESEEALATEIPGLPIITENREPSMLTEVPDAPAPVERVERTEPPMKTENAMVPILDETQESDPTVGADATTLPMMELVEDE
ncbi:MAG: hypothetical protein MI923_28060 [Phycisphaerales bacterium]|nr:hypothetical protein [Phycisphaerales bacterium]